MAHDYTRVLEYISENFKKELSPSGAPNFSNCTDECKKKIKMVADSEYRYQITHFSQTDRQLFHSYVAFTFGGIDFSTYCKMWSIFCEENGIGFSREYLLRIDSALVYNLNEHELFPVCYGKVRKDFLLFVYKQLGEYMSIKPQSEGSNRLHYTNIFSDLYDDRATGSIRQTPITFEEFACRGWTINGFLTYLHLCKNLYSACIEEAKLYFDIENTTGENKHPDVIASIINIKRFLYTKGICDISNRTYYAEGVEMSFAYGLQYNIYHSKFLPISIRGNNYRDTSSYIRDFDDFRMQFERALCWNNVGENYCLMHYVDGYFEAAKQNAGIGAFLDYDLPKYDFRRVELLIERLENAKRIHKICREELAKQLHDEIQIHTYDEFLTVMKDYELEDDICYYLDEFLEKLIEKKKGIVPTWTDKDTLYIYKGKTSCHTRKHEMVSATAILTGRNNSEIKLTVEYCPHCKKFLMSYTVYESYREKYGMLLGKLRMDSASTSGIADIVLADCSPIKLNGYSVNQQDGYSQQDRQYILSKVIEKGALLKSEVVRYLEYFINMNGRRIGNEIALSKWKQDLEFVLQYKIREQDEYEIRRIKKY